MVRPMPLGWGRVPYDWEMRKKWLELPFPVEEYLGRVAKVVALMKENDVDVLLVHGNRADRAAMRYLTNFEDFYGGDSIALVTVDGGTAFVTNAIMHGEPMHSGIQQTWIEDVRCAAHPRTVDKADTIYDQLGDIIEERGLTGARFGVAGEYSQNVIATMQATYPKASVKAVPGIMPKVMTYKSLAEVEALRKAAAAADAALIAVMENAKEGVSEFELTAAANYALFRAGAEETAFPIALGSGPRSGFKHTAPTDRVLKKGDMVYTDLGARVNGYYSDCSRNTVVGGPNKEQRDFMEANLTIVETVMKAAKPGIAIGDLAETGISTAASLGVEKYLYFRGHGCGTATHVPPSFFAGNPVKLEENMVFCFEPMLVRYEFGTACHEDLWWVKKDGVESLNKCPARFWE